MVVELGVICRFGTMARGWFGEGSYFCSFRGEAFFGICDLSLCSFMYDEYLGRILDLRIVSCALLWSVRM